VNKAERTERNMRVVLMRLRQVPVSKVAEAFGITDRQVRRIMADWRQSSLKRDTEEAVETVNNTLKQIRDDMETLGVTSANAPPEARVAIQGARMEQLNRHFSVLRDAGVSFEGLYEDRVKDLDLVVDVNKAFRSTLDQHGVEPTATNAAIEAGMEAFAKWGYEDPFAWMPLPDVSSPESGGGHNSLGEMSAYPPLGGHPSRPHKG
jgi:transposase-like protein